MGAISKVCNYIIGYTEYCFTIPAHCHGTMAKHYASKISHAALNKSPIARQLLTEVMVYGRRSSYRLQEFICFTIELHTHSLHKLQCVAHKQMLRAVGIGIVR